jgi:hypothetical protein
MIFYPFVYRYTMSAFRVLFFRPSMPFRELARAFLNRFAEATALSMRALICCDNVTFAVPKRHSIISGLRCVWSVRKKIENKS